MGKQLSTLKSYSQPPSMGRVALSHHVSTLSRDHLGEPQKPRPTVDAGAFQGSCYLQYPAANIRTKLLNKSRSKLDMGVPN